MVAVIRPAEHSSSSNSRLLLVARFRKLKHLLLPLLFVVFLSARLAHMYQSSPFSSSSFSLFSKKGTISCPQTKFPKRTLAQESLFFTQWSKTSRWVKEQGLTFLPEDGLLMHQQLINQIEVQGIPGMIVECGVAKAGSAITFTAIKHPQRCLHLFDTFEGIPEPSSKDGEDVQERYRQIQMDKQNCQLGLATCHKDYYGNNPDLLAFDREQFERAGYPSANHAVRFHPGLFDDTVWPASPIAYAHLDGDWYDSTYHMLQRISPFLSIGGYFVLDDVYQWSGAKNAYIDYFQVDLNWLQERKQQQQQPSQQDQDPPSCWTTVKDASGAGGNSGERYYKLVLDVRAMAQAISAATAKRLPADTVPRCVPPPPPRPTTATTTTTTAATTAGSYAAASSTGTSTSSSRARSATDTIPTATTASATDTGTP